MNEVLSKSTVIYVMFMEDQNRYENQENVFSSRLAERQVRTCQELRIVAANLRHINTDLILTRN